MLNWFDIITQKNIYRVKTPTILQMEAAECGAACLGIILAHYEKFIPLEELRVACGISRDGSTAKNILRAGKGYGLTTRAYSREPEQLPALMDSFSTSRSWISPRPLIVHWEFDHFVVVEGFGPDKVYINDPASGPRVVSNAEFDQSFTGVVLVLEPGENFEEGGQKFNAGESLWTRMAGFRNSNALIYVVLASLGLVLPGFIIPTFTRLFVDEILINQLSSWMGPLIIGLILTALFTTGLTWLRDYYLLRLETLLALQMAGNFFWHVLRLPVEFFLQRSPGEVGTRVALNDNLASIVSGRLTESILNVFTAIFYLILLLQYDVLLTIVGVFIATINIGILRISARTRVDARARLLQESGKLRGIASGGLQNIENIKANGEEMDFFRRWAGHHAKTVAVGQALAHTTIYTSTLPGLLSGLNTAVILTLGGMRVMNGELTIGMLVAFQGLMGNFLHPFEQLVHFSSMIQETEGSLKRLDDVLKHPLDADAVRSMPPVQSDEAEMMRGKVAKADNHIIDYKLTGHIEIKNLTFGYSPLMPPLIDDFNLTLKPGNRIALVGGSGSGKSTIAKLIAGLYKPWSGEILFDGQPRQEVHRIVLHNSLTMVDQDIFLFDGTIRENMTLWNDAMPDSSIMQAAKDAAIYETIVTRPGGYDGMVEEDGRNFSGGQCQRLEIARALVGNPTILILDEATSSLDPAVEKEIDDNLRRRGCTCLIVSHRLSTIRDCDEILVLDQGKVVQRGTHDEMRKQRGPYVRLITGYVDQKGEDNAVLESIFDKL
ncbi:MAG: NHLP family bacteriocin export ABC transporter peptidase/permease/ATPase subunit [Chloroflexota bacterium]